jgi:hypothetical protein
MTARARMPELQLPGPRAVTRAAVAVGGVAAVLVAAAWLRGSLDSGTPDAPPSASLTSDTVAVDGADRQLLATPEPATGARLEQAAMPGPADDDAPDEPARRRAQPTERDHYLELLALARTGAGNLERMALPILDGPEPNCRKVALLRAIYDSGSPATAQLFGRAIRSLSLASSPAGESVPSFAVRFLAARAANDATARAVLEQVAFDAAPAIELRRRAAAHFASAAAAEDLPRLASCLARESDGLLVEGAVAALGDNPHRAAVERTLWALGRSAPKDGDEKKH